MEDEFLVSYEAVTPGVPVLTRDKEQFGILEHVLEVPQLDLFDGIVVWVGGEPSPTARSRRNSAKATRPRPGAWSTRRTRAACGSLTLTRSPPLPPAISGATWTAPTWGCCRRRTARPSIT